MPTFTIVGGVNGAGKSSLSGVLKDCLDDLGVIVDPDRLTAQHGGDEYAGGQAAVAKLQDCLAQGIDFTEESTLSGSFSRKMARAARDKGYTVRLYYVGLDTAEESVRRIANRVARGGHDIPTQDVERRLPGVSGTWASCCRCATKQPSMTTTMASGWWLSIATGNCCPPPIRRLSGSPTCVGSSRSEPV